PIFTHAVARLRRVDEGAGALTDDLELVDRVGTLEVRRDQHGAVALLLEPVRQLARERRLAGALEAGQHDDGGRPLRELDATGLPAQDLDELRVHDLDDLLTRVEGL